MRYRIETFRGYEYEQELEKAISTAELRLKEVVKDQPAHRELWWVEIIDSAGLLNKLIYSTDEGQTASTPWLK